MPTSDLYNSTPISRNDAILLQELADIEAKLNAGVQSVSIDGTTTTFSQDALRKRADELRKRIHVERMRRPVASSVYLGGF